MPTPTLRPATPSDAPALRALYAASVRALAASHYGEAARVAWAGALGEAALRRRVLDAGELVLVAEVGGEVAGFGSVSGGEVELLYVAPEAAGRGVGGALLGALEAAARRAGHGEAALHASLNAVGFYEARGYRVVGREVVALAPGARLARVRMVKPL